MSLATITPVIREVTPADREAIRLALVACGAFDAEEVRVALNVLRDGLDGGLDGEYPHFVAELAGDVVGYICVGQTPMTLSTWHMYWICVHPKAQRAGVGAALQAHAETFIRSRGGQRIVLETSGRADYEPTVRFYGKIGYELVGRIKDFYKPADDCLFMCKIIHE